MDRRWYIYVVGGIIQLNMQLNEGSLSGAVSASETAHAATRYYIEQVYNYVY